MVYATFILSHAIFKDVHVTILTYLCKDVYIYLFAEYQICCV